MMVYSLINYILKINEDLMIDLSELFLTQSFALTPSIFLYIPHHFSTTKN